MLNLLNLPGFGDTNLANSPKKLVVVKVPPHHPVGWLAQVPGSLKCHGAPYEILLPRGPSW